MEAADEALGRVLALDRGYLPGAYAARLHRRRDR